MSIANGGEGSPPAIPRELVTNDYWHLADIEADSEHVRYWRVKRTSVVPAECPLMTQSGLRDSPKPVREILNLRPILNLAFRFLRRAVANATAQIRGRGLRFAYSR